ncbi:MAG TPA: 2-dehydropantoate 2-reductase [Methylomirabilota bacterium]|nr:2-dehydropantoate 2-reductase [Methylomirabilota bacterium]
MTRKVLFVGAGAIGSYLGAFLARAGHTVTLVDPWAEQIEAVRRGGLHVTGPHPPFEARPAAVHLNDAARLPRDFDLAVVAVKAYDTRWAAQLAVRHLGPAGYVVSAQNCWPDPEVAEIAGPGRAVGLVMSKIGVALRAPGQVERGVEAGRAAGHDVFRAGEHDGAITPRVRELAEMLSVIDGARPTDNLWGERWAKLCQNAMSNPLQAMSGLGSLEVASSEVGRALMIHLAAEGARVGLRLGHRVPPFAGAPAERWAEAERDGARDALDRLLAPGPGARSWRASMAQDVAKGRVTEIHHMNGHVVARGRECGVATPVNAAVVAAVEEIEAGERTPGPATLELTLRRAGR